MKKLAIVLLLVAACSKKSDSNATATKTTEEPAKTEPAKTEPVKVDLPKPEPAKVEPAKVAPATKDGEPSAADRQLVNGVGEQTKLHYKTATGDFVDVEVKQKLVKGKYVTEVTAGGKVIETIDSDVEKGDIHYEAKAAVNACPEGVLVVQKVIKVTGKPDDNYEGHVLAWDAAAKQLTVKRTIKFADTYNPDDDLKGNTE